MNYFDLHCDTPYECFKKGEPFFDGNYAVNQKKGGVFEKWCQVCAVWIPDECRDPKERYDKIVSNFKNQVAPVIDSGALDGAQNVILTVEGGAVIKTLQDVDMLYADGVRAVTLTWNGQNQIAGGSNTNAPLTDFGRRVIARMNELCMAVDLSHLNDRCFFEVAELARYPIVTHACCRAVHHVRRNLTDRQIVAVAQKNGLIGLCFYPRFLGEGNVFVNFAAHLSHLLSLVGENAVAIGSDFDGAKMDKNLDSVEKTQELYSYLLKNGFSDNMLNKLFYKNAFEYFKELLK